MDELLMDLQVFTQELLREHLAMKFSWNISLLLFEVRHTHIYRPFVPFQNGLKRCVFSKSFFLNFFTGNQLQDFGNRLHSYILNGLDFWIWISRVPLLVIDYKFKIQIQNLSQHALLRAGEGEAHGCAFQRRKDARSRHQRLFVKNVGKTEGNRSKWKF